MSSLSLNWPLPARNGLGLPDSSAWTITPATGPSAGDAGRDAMALGALAALLQGTGAFVSISTGRRPPAPPPDGDVPRAWIRAESWREKSEGDPEWRTRTVRFAIDVVTNDEDALETLADQICDAVCGAELGGNCIPALTDIDECKFNSVFAAKTTGMGGSPSGWDTAEIAISLRGQFALLVDGFGGHADPTNRAADPWAGLAG